MIIVPSPRWSSSAATDWSSETTSSIDAGRSAGLFAMQRSTSVASRMGASGRRSSTEGTGSLTCFIATARKLSPGYGTSPASSSYMTTPKE
jgi:hypothetical protein